MAYTVKDIATALGAEAVGEAGLEIRRPAEPASAGPHDLALAMEPRYAEGLAEGAARAAVLWPGADWQALGLAAAILVPRPRYAMAALTRLFDPGPEIASGVHPTALIHPSANVGEGAVIGPFVVIGRDVAIGSRARIAAHVTVAEEARIGDDALLLHHSHVGPRVIAGDRLILQPGAVVGADGLSFVTPEKSGVERARETLGDQGTIIGQSWTRIHSLGGVEIGDDVEIGANSTIDRGTIRSTRIGSGTKIDNLVHVAHNVEVGRDCLFAALVGIAGSTRIGDRVVLGGQVGVSDNVFVGDDVVAGGGTKILSNVPAGRVVLGYPALKMDSQIEAVKNIRRLPRLFAAVAALQKTVPKPGGND